MSCIFLLCNCHLWSIVITQFRWLSYEIYWSAQFRNISKKASDFRSPLFTTDWTSAVFDKAERSGRKEEVNLLMSKQKQTISARQKEEIDLEFILKETIESPSRSFKIRKLYVKNVKTPIKTSDKTIQNNFSKSQYYSIQVESKERNSDIFLGYKNILAIKSNLKD